MAIVSMAGLGRKITAGITNLPTVCLVSNYTTWGVESMVGRTCIVLILLVSVPIAAQDRLDKPDVSTPLEIFEQRIMPIFKSPRPASCVQCHLAGVDLKNYILPSHEQTFASLRDQGLVNLNRPEESKILTLIGMGEKDRDQGAKLIHEKTRHAEYEAFSAWITACCNDPKLRNLARLPAATLARPARPDEVIRHARKDRVVDSFVRNVWSQRMRCFPCHTPHELDESNPKLRPAIVKHKEFLEKYGADFAQRMNIFRETPEATIDYLVQKSRTTTDGTLPLINLSDPRHSLLVLKPTSKLPQKNAQGEFEQPSSALPVSHMGGLKMHVDDQSYKAFIAWIQDYARVVGNQYKAVADLPADNWFPSKHVVILREVPGQWTIGARVQILIHAWNPDKQTWHPEAIAFTQGQVTPIRNVAGTLFLFGPIRRGENGTRVDSLDSKLPAGKYLLKAFIDTQNRLSDDPTVMLGDEEFVGQVEIDAKWGEGFPQAERIPGSSLK